MVADLGLALIRLLLGALFVGHGLQKLTGAFGGHGIEGTAGYLESLGLRPGRPWALAAGLAELLGGTLFGLGFLTPVAAVLLASVMIMAIARVHAPRGLWVQNGGYEYPLVNIVTVLGVALAGPGAYAVDSYAHVALPVVPILAVGLALAILVVAVTLAPGERRPAPRTA
jgi:putative oxidoreductase